MFNSSHLSKLKPFMLTLLTARNTLHSTSDRGPDGILQNVEEFNYTPLPQANLITSERVEDYSENRHAVLLDLDIEHQYLESSSGNGHLYLDTHLTFDELIEVLTVLEKHGIVQHGFVEWTKARGASSLRPPWINKHDPMDNHQELPTQTKANPVDW